MTQEEKDLVLKDLAGRLTYGVKAHYKYYDFFGGEEQLADEGDGNITAIDTNMGNPIKVNGYYTEVENVKPYLRSMDSMTDKEQKYFDDHFCVIDEDAWKGNGIIGFKNQSQIFAKGIKWLLMNHFDFNGLIEKGLAIEVTEKNNPYK